MTRAAVFDVGTNSVKMFLCELDGKGNLLDCVKYKSIVRLGQNLYRSSTLDPAAYKRGMGAFAEFHEEMNRFAPDIVRAVGTSALRTAKDANVFIDEVSTRFGIQIEVISGEKEAEYISAGIIHNEPAASEPSILLDIGGGSTEISVCYNSQVTSAASLKLGAARGQQDYLAAAPPKKAAVKGLRKYLRGELEKYFPHAPKEKSRAIGSSGSIRALMRIHYDGKKELRPLRLIDVSNLVDEMLALDLSGLQELPGLEPERAPVILSAALVLEGCMKYFGCDDLIPTDFALKDGILAEIQRDISLH